LELITITVLNLSRNEIPDYSFLKDLKNLTELILFDNQIPDYSFLKDLKNLTKLYLGSNKISDISFLKDLKNLTVLNLSSNEISDCSLLRDFKNLTILNLYDNQISDISFLKDLKNLTELQLSSNKISDISAIENLKNLIRLYLGNNQISDISSLKDLNNLIELHLDETKISDISPLKDLNSLVGLNLGDNQITHLPKELVELDIDIEWERFFSVSDVGLNLYNNPLETPPIEIVKKGWDAVNTYFKSLEGEKQALNEVKVLLVGDGGSGKTSLVKQLIGEQFDVNEPQTHGINIKQWEIQDGENKIKVHLWDFGGQEIMHATHQFFLSKRSLYILVLDGRKEEKTEYWLKHIESFGGNSPILVVLNKIDENPSFDLNRLFLQEKYRGIKGFHRISCKKGTGIKFFEESLKNELTQVELRQTQFAKSWFNVKTQLESMADNFIGYNQYKEICKKEKITEISAQDTLLDFLHDLGVVLHFKDFELLDTHVLEPKWVTEAVYRIINSEKLAESRGVLRLKLLDEILKQEKDTDYFYPSDKYKYIVDLMKKFALCYEIDTQTVLIPDLLEVQEPKFDFNYSTSLKFLIVYDFLPKSVMPRFIVKRHKDIKNELRWRTGVVLGDKAFHSTAVVKVDENDKKIYIYVNGEQKRDYFSIIRKTFREINDSFEKLEFKELVPLPDNDEIAIEYEELLGYELEGRGEYFVGKLRKGYSVKKLLDGIEKEEARMKKFYTDKTTIEFSPHIEVKPEISPRMEVKSDIKIETNVDINLKVDLPTIQSDFENLKDILVKANPDFERNLSEIGDNLDEVSANAEKEKLVKPFNKLGRFLKKLGDENSDVHKLIKGTKKGVEYAQKLGKTYNKFAQWLALPQVPDLFL
jgi:small GTP-binding protein